ncbi:hypothetical protein AGMMS49957_00530 [Synergistales bacterium]|nr:hypothetical protein AGMMS49957_00530 [Synergistales bacterium]
MAIVKKSHRFPEDAAISSYHDVAFIIVQYFEHYTIEVPLGDALIGVGLFRAKAALDVAKDGKIKGTAVLNKRSFEVE